MHRRVDVAVISGGSRDFSSYTDGLASVFKPTEAVEFAFVRFAELCPGSVLRQRVQYLIDYSYGVYGQVHLIGRLLAIPVLGNPQFAASVYNKVLLKEVLLAHQLHTPRYLLINSANELSEKCLERSAELISSKVIVKPASADALSKGISLWNGDAGELMTAVRLAFEQDSNVILEEFIEGEEYCAGFIPVGSGWEVLPPARVAKGGPIFDHEIKRKGNYEFIFEHMDERLKTELAHIASVISQHFGLLEPFYVNYFRRPSGELEVFDCGSRVGLSAQSYFPLAMQRAQKDWRIFLRELFVGFI